MLLIVIAIAITVIRHIPLFFWQKIMAYGALFG